MICPNQSNRGPLEKKEKKEEENKCGSLPTADIVGAIGKRVSYELLKQLIFVLKVERYLIKYVSTFYKVTKLDYEL